MKRIFELDSNNRPILSNPIMIEDDAEIPENHVELDANVSYTETGDTWTPKLADVQASKIAEITQAYQQSIATFQSSALGTPHTYLADDSSMNKFNAKHYQINTATYDGSSFLWYTVEEGGVMHTPTAFNQVWDDGNKALSDAFERWDSIVKQIKGYTQDSDIPTIQAIVW